MVVYFFIFCHFILLVACCSIGWWKKIQLNKNYLPKPKSSPKSKNKNRSKSSKRSSFKPSETTFITKIADINGDNSGNYKRQPHTPTLTLNVSDLESKSNDSTGVNGDNSSHLLIGKAIVYESPDASKIFGALTDAAHCGSDRCREVAIVIFALSSIFACCMIQIVYILLFAFVFYNVWCWLRSAPIITVTCELDCSMNSFQSMKEIFPFYATFAIDETVGELSLENIILCLFIDCFWLIDKWIAYNKIVNIMTNGQGAYISQHMHCIEIDLDFFCNLFQHGSHTFNRLKSYFFKIFNILATFSYNSFKY